MHQRWINVQLLTWLFLQLFYVVFTKKLVESGLAKKSLDFCRFQEKKKTSNHF